MDAAGVLIVDPAHKADVLANSPANQTAFAFAQHPVRRRRPTRIPRLCGFVALNGQGGPGATLGSTVAAGA